MKEVSVMCGAYGLSLKTIEDIVYRFDVEDENVEGFRPRWNIRPGQLNPVIIHDKSEKNQIEMMLWGLLPTLPMMSTTKINI